MLKNLRNKLNDNKGFSLVELIVVIAIMVILIALLVPNVVGYIQKAQDSANLAAAKSIYNAANTYIVDYKGQKGVYPTSADVEAALLDPTNGLVTIPSDLVAEVTLNNDAAAKSVVAVLTYNEGDVAEAERHQAYRPEFSGNAAGADVDAGIKVTQGAAASSADGVAGVMITLES